MKKWRVIKYFRKALNLISHYWHTFEMLFLSSPGDVFIQPTQDERNPVVYGVFSTSGYIFPLDQQTSCQIIVISVFSYSSFRVFILLWKLFIDFGWHILLICILYLSLSSVFKGSAVVCLLNGWHPKCFNGPFAINTDTNTNGLHTREDSLSSPGNSDFSQFSLKLYEHFEVSPTVFVIA